MTAREIVLFGILVALGGYVFHRESVRNHREFVWLRTRGRRVVEQVERQRQRRRDLRAEAAALSTDHYYVEAKLRQELGWRPLAPQPSPVELPTLGPEPGELVQVVPRLDLTLPPLTGPPAPRPEPARPGPPAPAPPAPSPTPPQPQVDPDRAVLAALGYTSVEHFQRKMMRGQASGELDEATRHRARRMLALLQRLGYGSVVDLQLRHGLTPDGIYGRKTEQAVLQELRQRQSIVVESSNANDHGG